MIQTISTNFVLIIIVVELIISMTTFGFCLGLPAGLILERFGPKWASLLALIISVSGYTGFYLALVYPKGFGTSLFWLLVTSVFVAGKFSLNTGHPKTNSLEFSQNESYLFHRI